MRLWLRPGRTALSGINPHPFLSGVHRVKKILIDSNSATTFTGYGVQVALLAARLADDGYDVAISATYGHPAGNGMGSWTTPSGSSAS